MATFTPTLTLPQDRYGPTLLSSDNGYPTHHLSPDSKPSPLQALGSRQEASCAPISEAEVRALPGWQAIADYAKNAWGGDWDRTLTNPPEYPDRPASGCVSGDAATVVLDGTPFCSHSTFEAPQGKNGAVSFMQGTRSVAHLVVNRAATFTQSLFVTSPLTMPALSEDLHDLPAVLTIDNILGSTVIVNNEDAVPTNMSVPSGCAMRLTNTSCTATGSARVRVEARGWVWFNYGSQRDGHFKWAVSLDAVIQDVEQRASYVDLGAALVSSGLTAQAQQGCAAEPVPDMPTNGSAVCSTPLTVPESRKQGLATYALVLIALLSLLVALLSGYLLWRRVRQRLRRTPAAVRPRDLLAVAAPVQARASHLRPPPAGEKYRAWLAQLDRPTNRVHIPPY